jgi:hypothetical protein
MLLLFLDDSGLSSPMPRPSVTEKLASRDWNDLKIYRARTRSLESRSLHLHKLVNVDLEFSLQNLACLAAPD